MKKLLLVLSCALFSATAFAGVTRFAGKHVAKPAVKESAKVVRFSAKKAYQGAKATGKAAVKAAY